jgi:hypothetical protein
MRHDRLAHADHLLILTLLDAVDIRLPGAASQREHGDQKNRAHHVPVSAAASS